MSHGTVRCGAVPVFDARWANHHIAGVNLLHRLAPLLGQSHAGHHHQPLPGRVSVPGGAGARRKGDVGTRSVDFLAGGKQRIDPYLPGKVVLGTRCRGLVGAAGDLLRPGLVVNG